MESGKIGADKIERVLGIYTKLINGFVVWRRQLIIVLMKEVSKEI